MAELLRMRLLGSPELNLGGVPLTFGRRKAVGLLVYLALTGQPVARETLSTLFADETSEQLALQNLRVSLNELRAHVAGHLVLSRQIVAFNREAPHWIDVREFEHLVKAADPGDVSALDRATELYGDDLLAGFAIRNAPAFDTWLIGERQRLRDLALGVWRRQLDRFADAGNAMDGLATAERILKAYPVDEQTYRVAMGLLAGCGERERALRLYERCRAALAEQLGAAPQAETTTLYERIRGGAQLAAQPATPQVAISTAGPELAMLIERLAAPECRLVTILSASRAEATALALRVVNYYLTPGQAPQPHPFPDGVYMTSPAETPGGGAAPSQTLAQQISQPLGAAAPHNSPARDKLLELLRASAMLLVIDNLTPTDEDAELVAAILQQAPRVKLLVTAQEQLLLQEEWVLDMGEGRRY